jgi:hypothetical protein
MELELFAPIARAVQNTNPIFQGRLSSSLNMARRGEQPFISVSNGCYREVHRCGDQAAWWKKIGIDPAAAARVLWRKTHPTGADPRRR